jgi:hypothetical protein
MESPTLSATPTDPLGASSFMGISSLVGAEESWVLALTVIMPDRDAAFRI